MIESHRQMGHRRRIGPPPASAQSASRLFCAAESAINKIVTTGALLRADLAKIAVQRRSPHLQKNSDWKRISLPPGHTCSVVWPVNCRKDTVLCCQREQSLRRQTNVPSGFQYRSRGGRLQRRDRALESCGMDGQDGKPRKSSFGMKVAICEVDLT